MARGKKKSDLLQHQLSRRERQIMGSVYRPGKASVADVVDHIPSFDRPNMVTGSPWNRR